MMNIGEIRKDLHDTKGRVKGGRLMAHVIVNYNELEGLPNYEIAEKFGLNPNVTPDVAKAKATAKQLKELGWGVQKS